MSDAKPEPGQDPWLRTPVWCPALTSRRLAGCRNDGKRNRPPQGKFRAEIFAFHQDCFQAVELIPAQVSPGMSQPPPRTPIPRGISSSRNETRAASLAHGQRPAPPHRDLGVASKAVPAAWCPPHCSKSPRSELGGKVDPRAQSTSRVGVRGAPGGKAISTCMPSCCSDAI